MSASMAWKRGLDREAYKARRAGAGETENMIRTAASMLSQLSRTKIEQDDVGTRPVYFHARAARMVEAADRIRDREAVAHANDDRDAKLAEAGLKIVELERMLKAAAAERDEEYRARIAAQDEAGALEGEKDRLTDRVRQYARERDAAQRIVFSLGQKLRDARARLGNAYRELAGASEDGSDISVVFRYREGKNGGVSVEDASDLAVAMGVQFEAEIADDEGLDEPENEGSDQVA
jgi:hypothetical protein